MSQYFYWTKGFRLKIIFMSLSRLSLMRPTPWRCDFCSRSTQCLSAILPRAFLRMGLSRPLFLYFRLFYLITIGQTLPMLGFEPLFSGVRSNRSTNWAHFYQELSYGHINQYHDIWVNIWKCKTVQASLFGSLVSVTGKPLVRIPVNKLSRKENVNWYHCKDPEN